MRTLFYVTGLAVAVALTAILWKPQSVVADFSPRQAQKVAEEPFGAAEITRMLKGNIETGEVQDEDYIRLREAVIKEARKQALNKTGEPVEWTEMGPDNVGGRARAILIVTEDHIMSGGVSGGLWQSFNGGNNWSQVTSFPNLMVSSIALSGNGELYVGTGSLFDFSGGEGGSGFMGRGVWRSSDMGQTWAVVPATDPGILATGQWTAVDALIADPNRPNRVYVGSNAGFGYLEGDNYTAVLGGLSTASCQDIHIAHDGSYMLVSMTQGRVYRSTDNTYSQFEPSFGSGNTPGVLPQSGMGRARVYIVPQHPDVAYALFSTTGGFFGGVYHSSDAGNTWTNIWPSGIAEATPLPRGQGIYDLALAASPNNPDIAYVGGIEFWRVGPNYQAELAAFPFTVASIPQSMHVDIHDIVYSPEGVMWVVNDGGIYRSNNNGQTYIRSNRGFNITQYYGIDYTPLGGVIGGTQDNGSHWIPNDGTLLSDLSAFSISGGDGFDAAAPQVTEAERDVFFTTSQYGVLNRLSSDGAESNIYDSRMFALANADGEIGQFYTTLRLFEDTEDELSERYMLLINPFEESVTDSTFTLSTNNHDMPVEYTLEAGDVLMYWEELIRPERFETEPLTEDPDYFWLDVQDLTEIILECDTTETQVGEIEVIDTITPIDTCVYIEVIDDFMCFEIGADTTFVTEPVFEIEVTCDTTYYYASDTLFEVREHRKIQDPYTVMLTLGFRGSEGVWMTRDPLNFNLTPHWFRLGNAPGGGGAHDIEYVNGDNEFTGDVMFVSGWNGQLWRVTGLRNIWEPGDDIDADQNGFADNLQWTQILSTGGAAVTGVAIDINDPNHVIATVGGYGSPAGGKVRETFNAITNTDGSPSNPSWSNIWSSAGSEISNMPCYGAVIDFNDPTGNTVLVGTEYGIYVTYNGGDDWMISNRGMSAADDFIAAPVFDIRQQWRGSAQFSNPTNTGVIYAGSHGRGIFRTEEFVVVNVPNLPELEEKKNFFNLFPNPVTSGVAQVKFDIAATADVRMMVFNMQGRYIKEVPMQKLAQGEHIITLDLTDLPVGTYVLAAEIGSEVKTTRFVVMK